jgi:hypothetical protein
MKFTLVLLSSVLLAVSSNPVAKIPESNAANPWGNQDDETILAKRDYRETRAENGGTPFAPGPRPYRYRQSITKRTWRETCAENGDCYSRYRGGYPYSGFSRQCNQYDFCMKNLRYCMNDLGFSCADAIQKDDNKDYK